MKPETTTIKSYWKLTSSFFFRESHKLWHAKIIERLVNELVLMLPLHVTAIDEISWAFWDSRVMRILWKNLIIDRKHGMT